MLVLSRKANETIVIGHNISVTVLAIRGDKVRLGVTAPPEFTVHRLEVEAAIQRQQAENQSPGDNADGRQTP